ncbi:MAG: GntR family transcriptional regulator [Sphaerochaetaceae bacterium]|jgi:GntR family transcriptional regulator|nr:GntR family transcriptional regulator [Sphaerochaetaceae bacterium]NLO60966.1 GntR family transcriptional regulator [Spirochaetales bacterium]MDD2406641.1 GntR family transcriptional regulator [Sphaerochaetaceae bacterium]MDD3671033.1 GntR family transcriptional regulator [Sphaerochaetaceae bacterium]MDD4260019.1 GntR family transcriptional regulator [Sphaerochaetaceae bacterium]
MGLKYQSVFLELQNKIISGLWPEDVMIPTELELCKIHNVSRITVRRALEEMVKLGYIRRTRGRGSFVNGSKRNSEYSKGLISQDGLEVEKPIRQQLLELNVHAKDSEITRHMQGLFKHDGESIYQFRVLRYIEDQPYSIVSFFTTESIGVGLKDMDITQHNFIELYNTLTGKQITKMSRNISAIIPDDSICDILKVPHGSAHLWIKSSAHLNNHDIIGVAYGVYNGNLYDFAVNINLDNPPRGLL